MRYLGAQILLLTVFSLVIFISSQAHATCADPVAEKGSIVFNDSYSTMMFCDGTVWWDMKASNGGVWFASGNGDISYSSGNVGVGIDAPLSTLHVAGPLLLDNSGLCDGGGVNKGALRLNAAADALEICDGTGNWTGLTADGTLGGLSDIDLTGLTDDNSLVYDSAGNVWVPGSGSGSDTLAGLACATGEVAKFDGASWVCAADNTGGGGGGGSGSGDTLLADWPDAIKCADASIDLVLYLRNFDANRVAYAPPQVDDNPQYILYDKDSADYFSHSNMAGFDCVENGWSVANLESANRTFSLVSGGSGLSDSTNCADGDEIFFDSTSGGVRCADKDPDTFTFTDQTDVAVSTLIESDIVQITGIETAVTVSLSGDGSPEFRTCSDSSCSSEIRTWGSAGQSINSGDYLQLRLTSSADTTTTNSATATVGSGTDQWDVTTGQCAPAIAESSCVAHRDLGCTATDIYQIDPDGSGGVSPFDAVCDMTTDGGGWMMLTTTVPTGSFDRTHAFWNGTAGSSIDFAWSGLNLNTANLEKVIANVPFTEIRTPWWTATYASASTFAQKKASSEGWDTSTDTSLTWMYTHTGSQGITTVRCLLCTHAFAGSGDRVVNGLATNATATLSCAGCGDECCPWATSDCGFHFMVAQSGHRGNGNQACENASWIR